MFFVAVRVNFETCFFGSLCCLVKQLELDRKSSFMVAARWNRRRNVKVATRETLYQQVNISWYFYSCCTHRSVSLQLFQVFWNCHLCWCVICYVKITFRNHLLSNIRALFILNLPFQF